MCAQTIKRTVDVTPTVITCPATITVGACNGEMPASDITLLTATDGCGTPVITFVNDAVNLSGCTETTTRTYKATDACGNTATCAQTITKTDKLKLPSLHDLASIIVAACNEAVLAPDITLVTATNGCGTPVITFVN